MRLIGKLAIAAAAAAVLFGAESAVAAPQVAAIKISHANFDADTNLNWLHVAEVNVLQGVTDITSLASLSASSVYGGNPIYAPDQAVDGLGSTFFHAGSNGTGEYLLLSFASPTTVSSVNILGRGGGLEARDQYLVEFLAADSSVLAKRYVDDRTSPFAGTASGPVPEPATWGTMLLGLGAAGALMRRRKQAALAA